MPSIQSGRIVKSKKGRTATPHQRTHRWESFSTKISKLHSLDPLRKVRRHDLETEDFSSTTSYFRNGLEKWADLDVTKNYSDFKREVRPFCDSLPQILYFEDQIMGVLVKYISAQETESLESLLDLLTAFAHDLGVRFEKHYPRALSLIIDIASRRQDAAVVEWTFTCLAFLFKYLSKLLVPDIRPTYDAISPLLGKARNPPHIARFAAEALSFLVRKSASPANREKALPSLVEHVKNNLQAFRGDRQFGLYYHGVMTMFAEAAKGQGHGVHTVGPEIIKALLTAVPDDECSSLDVGTWPDAVCGVLVSLVHHATAETFQPILKTIIEFAAGDERRIHHRLRNTLYIRCLGTISGTRKGSRIMEWPLLLQCLSESLQNASKDPSDLGIMDASVIWNHIIVNVAIIWQQAPMDSVIPYLNDLVATMTRDPLMKWFIPFCSYFSVLDTDKFRSLFLRPFQKFIVMHWSEGSNEDVLCVMLPRMVSSGAIPAVRDPEETFSLPQSWQDQIVTKFERLEISPFPEQGASSTYNKDPKTWHDRCLPKYSALLRLLEVTSVRPSTDGPIADLLLRKLKLALRPSQSLATEEAQFIVSQGLSSYLRISKNVGEKDASLVPLLRAATSRYYRLTGFLEALLAFENDLDSKRSPASHNDRITGSEEERDPLLQCLVKNLSIPSHRHRLVSLQLLTKLNAAPEELESLSTMLQTEECPLDLQNIRMIAVHIRKLAITYANLNEDSWLRRAIPSFLFGFLTVRLTPLWDSAAEALAEIAQTKTGEQAVCETVFNWMNVPSTRWKAPSNPTTGSAYAGQTDFECRNLASLRTQAEDVEHVIVNSPGLLLQSFEGSQELVPLAPPNARSQALRILAKAPTLAEKRSRMLVPHLLSWDLDTNEQDSVKPVAEHIAGGSWSLFDKKSLLGVFAQFSNPKVLYQSQEVYEALLTLLASGDTEVQKSSLKAMLAWKQAGLKPYQENLEYLLDEARFRNELTVLFQGDKQIQPEHRSEVMPVLLRLLYGRSISKKGIASGRHGLHATRLAVLRQLSVEDMGSFLDVALGGLRDIELVKNTALNDQIFIDEILPARKQVGLLNMIESMINELGTAVLVYTDKILNAVLYCLVSSCRCLSQDSEDLVEEKQGEGQAQTSLLRVVRTLSLKSLIALLRNAPVFDWTPYQEIFVKEVVTPRVEKLPAENNQGISGTLRFLSTLALYPKTALFLAIDVRIVPKLMETFSHEKTKDEVKIFALGIVRSLVKLSQSPAEQPEFNELIKVELLDPNTNMILEMICRVLKAAEIGKDVLMVCIESLIELSPLLQDSAHLVDLIDISDFLLNRPLRLVNPKIKNTILSMLNNFLSLPGTTLNQDLRWRIYSTISSLFGFFKDRASREGLSAVLRILCQDIPVLQEVATLCADINAFKESRIDQPDYEKRLVAFNSISRARDVSLTSRDWEPLIHNLTFYIKHDEEYGVLSANSADGLCQFIETASCASGKEIPKFEAMLSNILLPAIHGNAKEHSETVRRETVRVLGFLVTKMPSWPAVADLVHLSPVANEQDADPSFFSNILSPATARQMRALQLLSKVNHHTPLSSRQLAHFFIPLLEHFIFGREEGSDDHGVGAQAATTISDLARSLDWPQYRAILRRYVSYVESKPNVQKQLIRLISKFVDALSKATDEKSQDAMEVDGSVTGKIGLRSRLGSTMPAEDKLDEDFSSNIFPSLLNYIHEKEETTVSSRVPVGIIIAKILKLLPTDSMDRKLPGVLTDICHILRSKALESREMARDTLAQMSALLGPFYFGFILKELKGALPTGYQLHVLSYTVHSILVSVIPLFQPGDLDYCVGSIVEVIMDDIFGVAGQEKDAEEYTSQMKEVKSSKSLDSMELVARTASVNRLVELVRPLQSLLLEKLDFRMVRKIDDLLSRISSGLQGNAAAGSRDTLVFCYEVVQQVYTSQEHKPEAKLDHRLRRYLIQKGAKKSGDRGSTGKYTYKLVRFAVDVLRAVFKKHENLRNASNITGFIPILGDAIVAGEEEVQTATFKLLVVLVKVPFRTDDATKLYKVAAKEATKSIDTSLSLATDLAQAALKLMSIIIRDRRDVAVKEAAVDMILGKLKDDLTEPLYRHVTFNFLRSVLDRKVETATVYDTLDYVGTVMITNDDKETRNLARGAFFQFLREYPQKKNRWAKQQNFIIANLKYEREGGRLSAMEIVHLLLMKTSDDFVQEVAATSFIPLVFVLANDDSEKCRLAAGELMKEIFRKADKERISKFLTLARNWLLKIGNPSVLHLAIQSFSLYFEARESSPRDRKDLDLILEAVCQILEDHSSEETDLTKTVLKTIPILIQKHPAAVLSHEKLWQLIPTPLAHGDAAVKLSSVQLLSQYLGDFYDNNKDMQDGKTIAGSHGLTLSKEMVERLLSYSVKILSPSTISRWERKNSVRSEFESTPDILAIKQDSAAVDETLAAEVSRVILVLSNFLAAGLSDSDASEVDSDNDDNDGRDGFDVERTGSPKITLRTLFQWLSDILVMETRPNAAFLVPKIASLDILSALIITTPKPALQPSTNMILTPLHHLTDPSTPSPFSLDETFKARSEGLVTKATETMDALQRKMGTAEYSRELMAVREHARRRREGRSRKRKIEAVAQPERFGRWKRGKMEKKVKRRKEKGLANRTRRREY